MEEKQSTVVLSVRVPGELAELLERRAGEQGKSSSELLRYALSLVLLPAQSAIEGEEQLSKLISLSRSENSVIDYLQSIKEDIHLTVGEHERILKFLKSLLFMLEDIEQGARNIILSKSLEAEGRERSEP